MRGWYHAPWQDVGTNGREFVHGLTRERVSLASPMPELDPHQTHAWNNYAVGFYNAPGATVIGRVWANHGAPNAAAATMPEGTVAAKLLFTTASTGEVPFLQGAPQWNAYIYSNVNSPTPGPASRAIISVRLLQIDVAVKDSRVATTTGWVFGTFVYGGGPGGAPGSGWTNVAPVGLMWGNDPGIASGGSLKETYINQGVHMLHLGYQGRLNRPVDNKASSCLSCHSTAGVPGGPMIPPKGVDPAPWFRNIPSGQPFGPGSVSTDYSLQLAGGIRNFGTQRALRREKNPQKRASMLRQIRITDQRPPRDGGPLH